MTRLKLAAALALCAGPALADPPPAAHMMRIVPDGAAAGSTMEYFGGPVIGTVQVAAVMWGKGVAPATVTGIGPFLQALVNSTYVDQLAQYSTVGIVGVNGDPGTNQHIARGTFSGTYTITPSNTSLKLTDGAIRKELVAQIEAGHVPPQSLNTLYMIYFPKNVIITLDGSRSCVSFGAYHEAVSATVTPRNVFYGVMPDCGGGFSSITNVSSHEFAEAVTDAIPTPGSNPGYPQAWNTYDGYEIGDLCEAYSGTLAVPATGQNYVVQEVFQNSTGACGVGNFTSP